ncbi:cutinase family protein [Gordonia sp. SID5947]|uniref:cutinase family protein n=1 Tax=Gordonia sp. SID5947 TaxID=2690315 RepID=UPI001370F7C8|nr:cutinase family protein [Gordonia sp. SID5947]MYR08215.1 cutinase family protein [Gordonia sp. SID5947]
MNHESHSSTSALSSVGTRLTVSFLCLFAALAGGMVMNSPKAAAASCSDVAVVFARGTAEPAPPIGLTGQSFVAALRSQLPGKSVGAQGVNYPASSNFNDRPKFVKTVADGVTEAQNEVKAIAASCPGTKIVLGGYSQGAVVAGYATSGKITIPDRYRQYESQVPAPLPAKVASHVTAVVLFAPPSDRFISDIGAPRIRVGAPYEAKTVRYCIPGDTICNGAPVGQPNALHVLYTVNGMTLDAARYVVGRV